MKDRDCESCKKFSRGDPYESEGYCEAKRIWVDPQEGEDCKMHEFTLWSASKYKDGTPIMSEPKVDINSSYPESIVKPESNQLDVTFCEEDCCPHWDTCSHTLWDKHQCPFLPHDTDSNIKYLEQAFTEFAKTQDELSEEYDAVLKTHGDTLEQHMERITLNEGNIDALCSDIEDLQRKVYQIYRFLNSVEPDFFAKVQDEMMHKGTNFCGNCTHCDHDKYGDDTVYACELVGEIVDPDSASCSMFEPPF